VKFKFANDDFSIMPFTVAKLTGPSELQIYKMMHRTLNRDIPGPLMEKKVFANDKISYYS